MATTHPIIGDCAPFLDALLSNMTSAGINGSELIELDHLTYRVTTLGRYQEMKQALQHVDHLASEATVNGRPISVFKLKKSLCYKEYGITALELPAPSATPYPEGLEHAEFIVEGTLEQFMASHPDLAFVTKNIGKEINPEVSLKFAGCSAKFHLRDILDVIRLQEESGKM